MTPEIVTIAAALLAGAPVALALDRTSRGARLAGESFLLGTGLFAVTMLLLSFAHIPWSLPAFFGVVVPVSTGALIIARRSSRRDDRPRSTDAAFGVSSAIDLLTVLLVGGFALYATSASVAEWDFWAIWGLKGRVFHDSRGIDWSFLADRWNAYAHPDYPPLVPLVYDATALVRGEWSDRFAGLWTAAWGAAALLLIRSQVRDATGDSRIAALATLAASGFALGPWIGIADTPMLALGCGGCLLIRNWLRSGDTGAARTGSVLLGLGALTKNEGVALLTAVAVALVIAQGGRRLRRLLVLLPGFLLAAIWQVPRLAAELQTDLVEGAAERFAPRRVLETAEAIARHPSKHLLLSIGVSLAIAAGVRVLAREERFLAAALFVQFCFVLLSYSASPWRSMEEHLDTSWERVVAQTMPLLLFLAVAALAPRLLPATVREVGDREIGPGR